MNIKIYIRDFDGAWDSEREFDEEVISIAVANGNYVLMLRREDYFGKLVSLYDMSKRKIEALPQ